MAEPMNRTIALISDVFWQEDGADRLASRLEEACSMGAQVAVLPELPINPWSPATRTPRPEDAEGPDGLLDRKAPGKVRTLDGEQRLALAEVVEQGPIPAIHGVVRWRLVDLAQWLWDEYCISVDQSTVSRELKALGYVKMTARPRHEAQNEYAVDDFKKTSPPEWRKSGLNSPPTPQ